MTLTKIGKQWISPTIDNSNFGIDSSSKIPSILENECVINDSKVKSSDGWCYGNSYQDGARKYCESRGLSLPTVSELRILQKSCGSSVASFCDGWFWTSEVVSGLESSAYNVNFSNGKRYDDH